MQRRVQIFEVRESADTHKERLRGLRLHNISKYTDMTRTRFTQAWRQNLQVLQVSITRRQRDEDLLGGGKIPLVSATPVLNLARVQAAHSTLISSCP